MFFVNGGVFMFLLLLLSVSAGTVILLRVLALREKYILPPAVEEALEDVQPNETMDAVERAAVAHPSPLARIVTACLAHRKWPRQENLEAVQVRAAATQGQAVAWRRPRCSESTPPWWPPAGWPSAPCG